ncbi:MAG: pyridoxal phosphate-dependent aminotransferase [Pseudomonadota bacterium]
MPYPDSSRAVRGMTGTPFGALAARAAAHPGPLIELHVGDTWPPPVVGARAEDVTASAFPAAHRYVDPSGWPPLCAALLEKLRRQNGFSGLEPAGVLPTAGCTGALAAAAGALLDPGDRVVLCSPHWPLIRGIVQARDAQPVEVPVYALATEPQALRRALQDACQGAAALYVSTPNNPSGAVLPLTALEVMVEVARACGLWIFSDEVYEDYAYRGEHVSIGALAPERTLTAFSFSKAYGQAGYRCGYLAGPAGAVRQARRIATHLIYNPPAPAQIAALAAMERGAAWLAAARERYRAAGAKAAARLGVLPPEGGTFLFLDVAEHLDAGGLAGFMERCLDRGLLLAPGPNFGAAWATHVRLCFTCAAPALVEQGVEILAGVMGR